MKLRTYFAFKGQPRQELALLRDFCMDPIHNQRF